MLKEKWFMIIFQNYVRKLNLHYCIWASHYDPLLPGPVAGAFN